MSPAPDFYAKSSEAAVVALARNGDRAAFGVLVKRRQSWIRNLMRRWCGDAVLADDLAQLVFLQAWRNIRQLQHCAKFAAWLKRLAVNVWLQHLRTNDALREAEEPDETLSASQRNVGLAMDLDRALAMLAVPERMCVVLSYHEGMTHGEIADLTDLPLGTVKSHIRRGTQRLQKFLSAYKEISRTEGSL